MTDPKTPQTPADLSDAELDALFGAAADAAPIPSGDVLARILADADALQPAAPGLVVHAQDPAQDPAAPFGRIMGYLAEALGGWRGATGLAGVAAVGLMIGISPPMALDSLAATYLGTGEVYLSDFVAGGEFLIDG